MKTMKTGTLTNFNVPIDTRNRFDAICHASGRTRTSVLVELMKEYVLEEGKRLIERQKELGELDARIQESLVLRGSSHCQVSNSRELHSYQETQGDRGFELPRPMFSDGREDW